MLRTTRVDLVRVVVFRVIRKLRNRLCREWTTGGQTHASSRRRPLERHRRRLRRVVHQRIITEWSSAILAMITYVGNRQCGGREATWRDARRRVLHYASANQSATLASELILEARFVFRRVWISHSLTRDFFEDAALEGASWGGWERSAFLRVPENLFRSRVAHRET